MSMCNENWQSKSAQGLWQDTNEPAGKDLLML